MFLRPSLACFLLILVCSGCSKSPAELQGTVFYRGKPLTSGTITIVAADNQKAYSAIGTEGRYILRNVAPGKAKISIVSHPGTPEALGGQKGIEIPNRYQDPEKSGLTVEVIPSRQLHDIHLKDS